MKRPPLTRREFVAATTAGAVMSHAAFASEIAAPSPDASPLITLVDQGRPNATIVTDAQPAPAVILAAIEIQHAVQSMTGATLPIRRGDPPAAGLSIVIGDHAVTRRLGLTQQNFALTEYCYFARNDRIILCGKDAPSSDGITINFNAVVGRPGAQSVQLPGMYQPQGSLRAAYHFLESCGARYYGPRPHQCIFPRQSTLRVAPAQIRREPTIAYTNGLSSDTASFVGWPIQKILYDDPNTDEVLLFARRLRTGGPPWYVNHTFPMLKYRERFGPHPDPQQPHVYEGYHPEFWPPTGSPSHQLCYTAQPLVEQVARDAADYFDGKIRGKPYGLPFADLDIFPLVPYDCGNYCTCDRCRKWLDPYRDRKTPGAFGDGTASDYIFQFANRVATILRRTHPTKKIACLAYEGYYWPPVKVQIEANIAVAPCVITCDHWNTAQRRNDWTAYQFWSERARRIGDRMHLWNYFHHPEELGMIGGYKVFARFSPTLIHQLAQRYERDNVGGVFLCGWSEGLDFYLLMKCYDNPRLDLAAVLDEYFTLSFGRESGRHLLEFYRLIESISMQPAAGDTVVNERYFWQVQGSDEHLAKLEVILNAARRALSDDEARRRFAAWENLMTYMKAGRAHFVSHQPGAHG